MRDRRPPEAQAFLLPIAIATVLVSCFPVIESATAASSPPAPASATAFYANNFSKKPTAAAMTVLGRKLFFDPLLSASGQLSCASCHDPAHAFAPANASAVQRGGVDGRASGIRAVPTLTYTQNIPPFTEHFFDTDGDDSVDQGPAGGRTWDGRSQSAHDQARLPLFSPFEMGNATPRQVVDKVAHARYADEFRSRFGEQLFEDTELAFKAILMSLEVFQQTPQDFYPYTSKYDASLRGHAVLSEQETRGLATFNDESKGNCARCHPSAITRGAFPQFTDYGYVALGVPRNKAIPVNANPRYQDLGLCGPLRTDLSNNRKYCGLFRTPTLRNVATRRVFFHNGVVHTLRDAVRFYAERDVKPENWFPRNSHGEIVKFDDLPRDVLANVEMEVPFGGQPGKAPTLSAQDIDDIVAFLETLTDGFDRGTRQEK